MCNGDGPVWNEDGVSLRRLRPTACQSYPDTHAWPPAGWSMKSGTGGGGPAGGAMRRAEQRPWGSRHVRSRRDHPLLALLGEWPVQQSAVQGGTLIKSPTF